MTTAWDHLPNKIHIDQVLVDLIKHQDLFFQASVQVLDQTYEQAYDQAYDQAYKQARDQARAQVYDQARGQAWEREQAYNQARHNTYYVARNALLALIAYDVASKYLTIPADQAIVYGELVGDSQYILLKPYLLAKHEIALLATA
jgi:hypothetical protein